MVPRPHVLLLVLLAACNGDETTTTTTTATTGAPLPTTGPPDPPTTTTTTDDSADSDATAALTSTSSTSSTSTSESTTDTTTEAPPDDPRLATLVTYAPRVWLHPDEAYFPSSVEFAFASSLRDLGPDGNWWLHSGEVLASPSDTLPYFAGDLAGAPVYAFHADKGGGVVDLVYFFWYPYNRGKEVVDTVWGNHVGDWEHITVRLLLGPDNTLAPAQVYLSAHSFGGAYAWEDLERQGTHPVVYAARGSHGVWNAPGDHVYMTIGEEVLGVCVTLVCADLTDETAAGTAWDTWDNLAGFDFAAKEGLGGEPWPTWMSDAFTDPGPPPPEQPGAGPIFRWGNEEDCSTLGVDISDLIGVCRLEDGPTGPVSKDVWGPELQ